MTESGCWNVRHSRAKAGPWKHLFRHRNSHFLVAGKGGEVAHISYRVS